MWLVDVEKEVRQIETSFVTIERFIRVCVCVCVRAQYRIQRTGRTQDRKCYTDVYVPTYWREDVAANEICSIDDTLSFVNSIVLSHTRWTLERRPSFRHTHSYHCTIRYQNVLSIAVKAKASTPIFQYHHFAYRPSAMRKASQNAAIISWLHVQGVTVIRQMVAVYLSSKQHKVLL